MTSLAIEWGARMLNALIQGGAGLLVVLAVLRFLPGIPMKIQIGLLRLALVKLCLTGAFLGGVLSVGGARVPDVGSGPAAAVFTPLLAAALGMWSLSVLLGIIRVSRSVAGIKDIRAGTHPLRDEACLSIYSDLLGKAGIKLAPELAIHHSVRSPMLIQGWRPLIVLPQGLMGSPERVRIALAHELAHYRAGDLRWSWLPAIADLLFFFHPLLTAALKRLRLLEEAAADHAAMNLTGTAPSSYSRFLLGFAEAESTSPGAFALREKAEDFEKRIRLLYQQKKSTRRWLAMIGLAAAAGALVPLSAGRSAPETFSPASVKFQSRLP